MIDKIGKREFFYAEEKLICWRKGYSLGTVYDIDTDSFHRFKLHNFGYCPSLDTFYFNRNIHLPKKLIEYFESYCDSMEELEKKMHELGIYKLSYIYNLVLEYNKAQVNKEFCLERIRTVNSDMKSNVKNER